MKTLDIYVEPMGAPRQTRADSWRDRPVVLRYRAVKDLIRKSGITLQDGDGLTFHCSMPKSWSKKKKLAMNGQAKTTKPDLDNMLKTVMDAMFEQDEHIWHLSHLKKVWSDNPRIEVTKHDHA